MTTITLSEGTEKKGGVNCDIAVSKIYCLKGGSSRLGVHIGTQKKNSGRGVVKKKNTRPQKAKKALDKKKEVERHHQGVS